MGKCFWRAGSCHSFLVATALRLLATTTQSLGAPLKTLHMIIRVDAYESFNRNASSDEFFRGGGVGSDQGCHGKTAPDPRFGSFIPGFGVEYAVRELGDTTDGTVGPANRWNHVAHASSRFTFDWNFVVHRDLVRPDHQWRRFASVCGPQHFCKRFCICLIIFAAYDSRHSAWQTKPSKTSSNSSAKKPGTTATSATGSSASLPPTITSSTANPPSNGS